MSTWRSRHLAVAKVRGKASEHQCVDCDKPAREWSQMHDTDGESPGDYEPRCKGCHNRYDGAYTSESQRKSAPPGRTLTPEHRANIVKSWASHPERSMFSEQHRANLRAAWVRRKEGSA